MEDIKANFLCFGVSHGLDGRLDLPDLSSAYNITEYGTDDIFLIDV